MINLYSEKWEEVQYNIFHNSGKWVYEAFYGPICEFDIVKYEQNRVTIIPKSVRSEAKNAMSDFRVICLIAREFLEEYEEVSVEIPKFRGMLMVKRGDNVEEMLMNILKREALI